MKKALLVISFGTSYPETRKKNIEHLEQILAGAFPDRIFYHAYTSGMILRKLQERDGIHIPTVVEAMQQICADGITDLLVQPTHIINGIENDQMKQICLSFRDRIPHIAFGTPLLTTTQDQFDVIDALSPELPTLTDEDAFVFMGHGTSHYVNSIYAALDYAFKSRGHHQLHIGTIEAWPDLTAILEKLSAAGASHVYLSPFMLVAGDHAFNDLAGDEEDSWKSILESKGYRVTCILKGLGEYDSICRQYVAHAKEALSAS